MTSSGGKYLFAGVIACVACLAVPGPAAAQWGVKDLDPFNKNAGVNKSLREFDKERLNKMAGGSRAGRDYTKNYVKNESSSPIWVAGIDIPFDVAKGNESKITDPTESPFHVHAWYKLDPDETKHVSNTSNRNVYVYAQNNKGSVWEGKTKHIVKDDGKDRVVGFNKHTFEKMPEEFTIRFTK